MNGLPSANNGSTPAAEETVESRQLQSILRSATRDHKVIFGAHRGVFDLSLLDIENFVHLVDQRVAEQNTCGAYVCEIAVYYSDGTSRRFPDLAEFSNYSETRKRFPTVVTVHTSYFIEFPDAQEPEIQEIDIVIRSSESTSETVDMVADDARVRMSSDKVQMGVGKDESKFGIINYTINHSQISWGLDLEGHIRGHIESLMIEPNKSDRFLMRATGPLNLFTTLFVGLYIVNLIIDSFFWFLYRTDGANAPEKIIETAATYLVNGHIAKYIVASLVVSVVFFVLFSALVSAVTNSIKQPKPSFISLNEGDNRRKTEKLKSYEKRWPRFVAVILLNLFIAILVTYLEERITPLLSGFS
ncbi:hypothetical protein [Roseovarius sp. E0-M6]|uniref:hypothetical protein n=1 Tax=Roseovarius sp. E0-M6 TaxID=3127118 RepID=UPI00300FEED9